MKKNQLTDTKTSSDDERDVAFKISNRNTETMQTIDLDDKIELERREAYIEPKTRQLLRELIQCEEKDQIIPNYNPGLGFVYQLKEQKTDAPEMSNIPKDFLENLARLDI